MFKTFTGNTYKGRPALKCTLLFLFIILSLNGCADHVEFEIAATREPVGFLHGIWHGAILPFAWLVSLFDSDVSIYAIYNNGGWYDFGFFLGVAGAFGGGGSVTNSSKK